MQKMKVELLNLELQISDLKSENVNLKKQNEAATCQVNEIVTDPQKNISSSKNSVSGSDSPECFEIIDRSTILKKRDSIITLEDNISNNSFNPSEWTNVTVGANENYEKLSDGVTKEISTGSSHCMLDFSE